MTEQPQDAVPASELQAQLVASGAHPVQIDSEALLAQIQALQERLGILEKERGVPSDPIAGGKANLIAHIQARAAQYPYTDFSEILQAAKDLPDDMTRDHTDFVKTLVTEFVDTFKHFELGYLPQLATTLHKEVLKKAVSTK